MLLAGGLTVLIVGAALPDPVVAAAAREASEARIAQQRQAQLAMQVEQVRRFEAEYARANGGVSPPQGYFSPLAFGPPPGSRTNVLAVVAFILSFVAPLLGIILGHVADGQIHRSGERGRGLANAALAIGYTLFFLELIVSWGLFATFVLHTNG